MLWWIIGIINIILAIIELIVGFKSKDKHSSTIHILFSLMFISYGISAFNLNLIYGIPGLIFGLLAVFLSSKYRKKTSVF